MWIVLDVTCFSNYYTVYYWFPLIASEVAENFLEYKICNHQFCICRSHQDIDLSDFELKKVFRVCCLLHKQAVTFFPAKMFYDWFFLNPSLPFERILFTLSLSYQYKNHVAAST